jgi:hypothetical protein
MIRRICVVKRKAAPQWKVIAAVLSGQCALLRLEAPPGQLARQRVQATGRVQVTTHLTE